MLLLILFLFCLSPTKNATANPFDTDESSPIDILNIEQIDNNKDGKPNVTIIDCSFSTKNDRVIIFDQNGDG